ncbi:MAG: amidohydrolase family protein [Acidobacteriota bacterium]
MLTPLLAATLALRGATLVDGNGGPPVARALLVVRDGRVVSAGAATPEALKALPADVRVIDVTGRWIVPGLIDAHVHAESDEDLRAMLRWGVTSARLMAEDVGSSRTLAKASGARSDAPEVFPAAPIFTVAGGWWSAQPPDAGLDRFPATPDEARASVRKAKALGSTEIKLMLDDMAWCRAPLAPLVRVRADVASALLDEARRQGMRAIVHAPGAADAREAVSDGATALAHGALDPLDESTVATMKARPVYYVPTMDIFEFLADTGSFVDHVLSDPRVTAPGGLPAATVARMRAPDYAAGYRARYPAYENVRRHLPLLRANIVALHRAGVPIALGTDMWAFPGLSVSIEMELYVRAGLTPLEALRAATETAARSMGIDADRGTLSPGKRADFLVLTSDPLADPTNVRAIETIYKAGRPVGPGTVPPPRD